MGIYNTFVYGDGTTYGQTSSVRFSVEPFDAVVLKSKTVRLDWIVPSGEFQATRLIRNSEGVSEHHEDGVILFTDDSSSVRNWFLDENGAVPLVDGKHAYYSIWALLYDFSWVRIGSTSCLLPNKHDELAPDGTVLRTSEAKFANLLPATFVSKDGYTDVVDTTSDLYAFLSSMSLILDEVYTNAENLTGVPFGEESTFSQAVVEAANYGLTVSPSIGMITLKRLIRQAISNYQFKGTEAGLRSFCQALTRYGVEIFSSPNILLNVQDSTFYKDAGDWASVAWDSTQWTTSTHSVVTAIESDETYSAPDVDSAWISDYSWFGEVVTDAANSSIGLGVISPKTLGIPVNAGTDYSLYFNAKVPSGSGTVTASITWFDRLGNIIGSSETSSTTVLTSTWQEITGATITAPWKTYNEDGSVATEAAVFAGITLNFSDANTYHIDMFQFADVLSPLAGVYSEARAVEVFLHPDKVNLVSNPSFETLDALGAIENWTFSDVATQVEATIDGLYHVEYVAEIEAGTTTSSAPLASNVTNHPIYPGKFYTFSMYVRTTGGTTGTMNLGVILSDTLLDVELDPVVTTFTATEEWQRVSVRVFIPTDFTTFDVDALSSFATLVLYGNGSTATLQLDSAQFEQSYSVTDYFDGDLDSIGAFYSGDDTETELSEDVSYVYFNASSKIPTLANQLQDQLPRNTAFVITVGDINRRLRHTYGITD